MSQMTAGRTVAAVLTLGVFACVGASVSGHGPAAVAAAAEDRQPDGFDTVVLDAGHGGDDRGARGAQGLLEKDLVLDVSQRLASRLRERGFTVVLTREDDRFVGLEERTSIANDARGDLFLSIHANASTTRRARGTETFFASLEASDESALELAELENMSFRKDGGRSVSDDPLVAILGDLIATEHLRESQEFARFAQERLANLELARSRGVKQAPFVVLLGVQMPAALVEVGFLTNNQEEAALRKTSHRELIAEALDKAVVEFAARYDARRGVSRAARRGGG